MYYMRTTTYVVQLYILHVYYMGRTSVLSQEHVSGQSGRVGSLQLIQQGCSDNQIDHKLVLGFISCYILIIAY